MYEVRLGNGTTFTYMAFPNLNEALAGYRRMCFAMTLLQPMTGYVALLGESNTPIHRTDYRKGKIEDEY